MVFEAPAKIIMYPDLQKGNHYLILIISSEGIEALIYGYNHR